MVIYRNIRLQKQDLKLGHTSYYITDKCRVRGAEILKIISYDLAAIYMG